MNPPSTILISACLLGEPCRFDGQGKKKFELLEKLKHSELVPFCPEVEGGLPTPRPPAEVSGERVIRKSGEDVTAQFQKGASAGVKRAQSQNITLAILKSRSPACGCGQVYDGTFTKKLIPGDGIFTQNLKAAGIDCISDEQFLESCLREGE